MQVTTIKPKKGVGSIDFGELFRFRELFWVLAFKEFQIRYKQTIVGVIWAIIRPLMTMIVFSVLFGKVAKIPSGNIAYPVFSYSGLLLWNYFSTSITLASNSMVNNSKLITKVYFPRIIIPTASTIVSMIDYALAFFVLIGMLVYYKVTLTPSIWVLPLVLFGTWVLSVGLSFWFSAINVKYRDVQYALPFVIQLMMYLTPVIYPMTYAGRYKWLFALNPVSGFIEAHRAALVGNVINWDLLGLSFLLTAIILVSGYIYFKSVEKYFADII